ncbi:molybdenum ABC transporter substrate-binding protein [Colwellia sp. MT41]|uniref:molybdate ABC transporter substrate-binding protein n=1 Tax=Colwellia sp. MT41 TaxID=58049 RepID=UPI000717769A|nr:molybdate ABC transporter substrate-binding protein [Colwellia sp. MT41]ALO36122.1 molybdenum ABC transporter substrate-binding protein [Colwellia sp. MT41]
MLRFLLVTAFTISLLWVTSSQAQQNNTDNSDSDDNNTPLRIAVAANFTPVLKVLLKEFSKQTGINSQIISGASGAMFLQIKHGAPFDIFLSADSRRPKELEQDGFARKNSRKTYAIGQLAFYTTTMPSLEQLSIDLEKNPPQRFAIANPDIAPYGKAAKEALQHLGLWSTLQYRLITGINIGQTFAQLRSKAVTRGIVANSQLVLNNLSGVLIPTSYHQPIEQQLVIIRASKRQAAAKSLSDFLLSAKSQATIVSYGYAPTSKAKG